MLVRTGEPPLPPDPSELEISIIGPGVGESVVAHVGDGYWIVVDTAAGRGNEPDAVRFLRSRGVEPDAVRIVVGTHHHEDHVRALAATADLCSQATVLLPRPLHVLHQHREHIHARWSNPIEQILRVVERHGDRIRWIDLGDAVDQLVPGRPTDLRCIAPEPESVVALATRYIDAFVEGNDPRKALPRRANDVSVVLLVEKRPWAAVLGADLERRRWPATMAEAALLLGSRTVDVVKVPHHGARSSYAPELWAATSDDPIAVLAPNGNLPRPTDLDRLQRHTRRGFTTSPPTWSADRHYVRRRRAARTAPFETAWITARFPLEGPATVYLGDEARDWRTLG